MSMGINNPLKCRRVKALLRINYNKYIISHSKTLCLIFSRLNACNTPVVVTRNVKS